ncbi:hypothetical protein [Longimicrobium sp.]|uniref:hypothetical protein n=1 Tax=Longimicrobium sp. TaxID=2029185 RepID=UPI002D15D07A|nr:hypothetical protein [Longimicrobium sp.]HSU15378.1 hypothetical protein [Longimicrobium sp.]
MPLYDALPAPTEAELLAASGYPHLPVRVRHRAPLAWHPLRDGEETARYAYIAADGEPRFECIRFHLRPGHEAAPDKAFLWRAIDRNGGGRWGLDDVDLVPYRLPRILAAAAAGERVFVVEGEKDVHALEMLGLIATCNPLGAMQWTNRHAEALRGAEAIVIPDHDRAGMVHAGRVMTTLRGRARSAALLLLPGLERGEDVSDWIARGGSAAELNRLAGAAPRDPSPAGLAALLNLPMDVDPLATSPEDVRALLVGAAPDGGIPAPHPGFRRSAAAFARLGAAIRPPAPLRDSGLPDAHPTWRAVAAAVRDADGDAAAMLDDASLLDRASYELGLLSGLLRAAMAGEPPSEPIDATATDTAFVTAPAVRLVRTRWDWDAFIGDPDLPEPPEPGPAWVFHLPPSGAVQMRRLHPLPAMVLELCARPHTRAQAAAAVAERVEGDPARIAALVHAQIGELHASGFLRPAVAERAEGTIGEMKRLLLADEAPQSGARSLVGMLARAVGGTREAADDATEAGGDSYPVHLLDVSVNMLEQLLASARLRGAFAAELDGYWAGGDVHARVRSLAPLLDALARALGNREQALAPYVIAE